MVPRLERGETLNSSEISKETPLITVIVRARNEAENIEKALRSLNCQTIPREQYQALVIDNGSTDETGGLTQAFFEAHPDFPGKLISERKMGRAKALLRGLLETDTKYVAFLDADSSASRDWLRNLVWFMESHPEAVAVSGRVRFKNGPVHHRVLYEIGRETIFFLAALMKKGWSSGTNLCLRNIDEVIEVVRKIEGCDNTIPEDRVLSILLRAIGEVAYCPGAEVETDNWLLQKTTWLSDLATELDGVRETLEVPESGLHKVVKPISATCARWDSFKNVFCRDFGALDK